MTHDVISARDRLPNWNRSLQVGAFAVSAEADDNVRAAGDRAASAWSETEEDPPSRVKSSWSSAGAAITRDIVSVGEDFSRPRFNLSPTMSVPGPKSLSTYVCLLLCFVHEFLEHCRASAENLGLVERPQEPDEPDGIDLRLLRHLS